MRAVALATIAALLATGGGAARTANLAPLCQPVVRTQIPVPRLPGMSFEGVAAAPDGSIWAVGADRPDRGFLLHSTGGRFERVATRKQPLDDVVVPRADQVWVVGFRAVLRRDDGGWRQRPARDAFLSLSAVSAPAPDDVWAVGSGTEIGSVVVLTGTAEH
jgi:hypothetical protein